MKHSEKLKKLVICALMIAVANVLSFVKIDMPMGGGLTVCSMVPIVFVAFMYGPAWGLSTAFIYSVFQLLFGLDNVAYATNIGLALLIIFFDYIVAYSVVGLAGFFRDKKRSSKAIVLASVTVLLLRFVCHFITGAFVWDALWPNEFGLSPVVYSLVYNGIYMLPEIIITSSVSALLCCAPQIVRLFGKPDTAEETKKDSRILLISGICLIAVQIGAYVGLYFSGALTFFADTSSAKLIANDIWNLFSCSLVGIIGVAFTLWAVIKNKARKS